MIAVPAKLRPLAYGSLLTSVGDGAWLTAWALFLTRALGLSPGQAGLAFSVAGVAGIAAATPLGQLADRVGAREVLVALVLAEALGMSAYLLADGLVALTAVACLISAAGEGATGVRTALIARLTKGRERMEALASLRVVRHVGFAAGGGLGALVIQIDTRTAYAALIAANAATFAGYACAVARLPRVPPGPRGATGPALPVLRDVPYMTLAAICGVLTLCWGMLSTGLPLWVALHTDAPRAISAAVMVLNSVAIAGLQVRFARRATEPLDAAGAALRAGIWLAVACALFALADGPGALAAAALIGAGGVAHVVGELLFVAGKWGLSVPLMRDELAGQYQGVFATGEAAALMASPAIMTLLVAGWGRPGWVVLGALFVFATLPAGAVTRRALRQRAQPGF